MRRHIANLFCVSFLVLWTLHCALTRVALGNRSGLSPEQSAQTSWSLLKCLPICTTATARMFSAFRFKLIHFP